VTNLPLVFQRTYYDYANNRLRLDIEVRSLSGRTDRNATEIYLWSQRIQYVIERGECRYSQLTGQ
jgi:hypothetical protein